MQRICKNIALALIYMYSSSILAVAHDSGVLQEKTASSTIDIVKTFASNFPTYVKDAGNYLFSAEGIKDALCAFCIGIALTVLHELGHAVTAKLFHGSPINIVVGTHSFSRTPYATIGGIRFGGFNPAIGATRYSFLAEQYHPLKEATVAVAGPITGAIASSLAFIWLKNRKKMYLAKAAALFSLINHTVGVTGLGGIFFPKSDSSRVVQYIKEYLNQ